MGTEVHERRPLPAARPGAGLSAPAASPGDQSDPATITIILRARLGRALDAGIRSDVEYGTRSSLIASLLWNYPPISAWLEQRQQNNQAAE